MEISIQYTAFCFKNMPYRDPFNQLKHKKEKSVQQNTDISI